MIPWAVFKMHPPISLDIFAEITYVCVKYMICKGATADIEITSESSTPTVQEIANNKIN